MFTQTLGKQFVTQNVSFVRMSRRKFEYSKLTQNAN